MLYAASAGNIGLRALAMTVPAGQPFADSTRPCDAGTCPLRLQWAGAVNGTVVAAGAPAYYPDWQASGPTLGVAADGAGITQASWAGLGTQEFPTLPFVFGANNAAVQVLKPPVGSSSALAYVQSLALPGRACFSSAQNATLATLVVCDASEGGGGGAKAVPARADLEVVACPLALTLSTSASLVCFAVSVGHVSPFV